MMLVTLNEIYNSSWGVLANRRLEAEAAAYGKFDEVYDRAIADDFYTIESIAAAMNCHPKTASKRLREHPVRYIEHKGRYWYQREDAKEIIAQYPTKGSDV